MRKVLKFLPEKSAGAVKIGFALQEIQRCRIEQIQYSREGMLLPCGFPSFSFCLNAIQCSFLYCEGVAFL